MLIYLASPYTDPDAKVRRLRYKEVRLLAGKILQKGIHVLSPIVHCHHIAIETKLPHDYEFWDAYDKKLLRACDQLWVATLPGWEKSKGVKFEIEYMHALDKIVQTINPTTLETKYLTKEQYGLRPL